MQSTTTLKGPGEYDTPHCCHTILPLGENLIGIKHDTSMVVGGGDVFQYLRVSLVYFSICYPIPVLNSRCIVVFGWDDGTKTAKGKLYNTGLRRGTHTWAWVNNFEVLIRLGVVDRNNKKREMCCPGDQIIVWHAPAPESLVRSSYSGYKPWPLGGDMDPLYYKFWTTDSGIGVWWGRLIKLPSTPYQRLVGCCCFRSC